jgi:hypothetical protein
VRFPGATAEMGDLDAPDAQREAVLTAYFRKGGIFVNFHD